MTFFRSRWVEKPAHVTELDPDALPKCFCSAGVAAGIKPKGLDVGVLASFDESTSAARFTTNARVGAPVIASKEARLDGLRAVVANSGCSNVGDGERGLETARAMQLAVAEELELEPDQVGVASTGVIGLELPRDKVVSGARAACGALSKDAGDFSEAILTSDAGPKRACLEVALPSGGTVRLAAQAKGAGMISPRYATMFCFVQTDAGLDAETLDLLTGVCVKRSFDRISVDGQLSTSDTVFAIANGASGVRIEPQTPDELALGEAMDALLRQLALEIVHDGEGCQARRPDRRAGRQRSRRARGALGGRLAARQDGAPRRRSELRPHPAGGRARRSRRPRRSSSTSRSRVASWCLPATRSTSAPRSWRSSSGRCRATRWSSS